MNTTPCREAAILAGVVVGGATCFAVDIAIGIAFTHPQPQQSPFAVVIHLPAPSSEPPR